GFPDSPGLEEVHPFSISSSPDSETLTIGVKSLGDYTACIKDLAPGARAVIEGPFGRTSYRYLESKDQIWIAGGIGITPFLGMARALKPGEGYHIDLYYSVVEEKEAAFLDELKALAEKNPDLRVIPWFTKTMSYLTADAIIEKSGGVMGREIVMCGPPPMMKAMRGQLEKWKVPVRHIHSEEFSMN
ncbi:MAG TPA: ferric reductase, partial [Candidatus Paceibacterota bacterium]|nr:ferric reductase [Candidatus Paceibacterota bacterium]